LTRIKYTILLAGLVISQNAFAHSPIKGIGFLFNGMLHPFLIPAHVLVIVALGFWIGQLQPIKHRVSILLYLFSLIAGLTLSAFDLMPEYNWSLILLVLTVIIGISTFIGISTWVANSVPVAVTSLICIIVALVIGLDSQVEDLTGSTRIISLVGNGVGSYLMLLYAIAISETMSVKRWQQIGIRVLTSWLSASALMVLALNFSSLGK